MVHPDPAHGSGRFVFALSNRGHQTQNRTNRISGLWHNLRLILRQQTVFSSFFANFLAVHGRGKAEKTEGKGMSDRG
jgi:hypothetical protein